ncbi:chlorophyll a-b binding protein of LHCII type I, chloroplastic [Physcomitrium patens]|uniref:Chlorophyll a-b binding protein, chloroplastic n=2 Tax=Physcomitrium patens TaxID=3218 RepID=A0A2K1KKR9_PHYPA|nr:chlorophyll a-b binding protein of LHCII type 1-like [Physcomitrium patens]PNR54372.1 hypothetical protein PHYPA_008049 [Physcomitrium patens]8HTU_9 Chain 9, Chlorophyll a-b binding protein, chloroplastic [Physcomitrium patens]|eukprot:XP_024375887.1 chlorophyll a-b binding protein of LHCII type 1-like [Physcomitrella patens]
MASMAIQGVVAPAVGAFGSSKCFQKKPSSISSSSWTCQAVSKGEGTADAPTVSLEGVINAVQQAPSADPAPEALLAESTSNGSTATMTGIAEWYKVYGKSVAPDQDARAPYYGPNRPLWKGPFTKPKDVPEYLKGEYPGDYGCDIFKLARLPANYARLRTQELMNGRWAMLGITGCLTPELINSNSTPGFEPVWFNTGAQIFSDAGIDYLGVPGFINAHSLFAVIVVQALLMGLAEYARIKFVPEGADPFYPGGKTFDPLGFSSDPEILAELKVKEIKNGRLAMMAMAGLFAQGAVTGVSPLQNLHDWLHL